MKIKTIAIPLFGKSSSDDANLAYTKALQKTPDKQLKRVAGKIWKKTPGRGKRCRQQIFTQGARKNFLRILTLG
ncbi:MAG: hypothetical protein N3A66_07860 [Planctomycetota bacterium]|nr:hypothetical protein [Planctomycetota bacterium]